MMYDEWMRKSIIKLSKSDLQDILCIYQSIKLIMLIAVYTENSSFSIGRIWKNSFRKQCFRFIRKAAEFIHICEDCFLIHSGTFQ